MIPEGEVEGVPILYLVRHGKAASAWSEAADPGLDDRGREQAEKVAGELASLGPLDIVTSPLARARETAEPLARAWGVTPRVDPRVGEIESPGGDVSGRSAWLYTIMRKNWIDLDPALQQWRQRVMEALLSLSSDTVVFTHYVAINVAVGSAVNDNRVIVFSPDNCSVTKMDNKGGCLALVERGVEAVTEVR